MEGQLKPGAATMFRLQSNSDSKLVSYIAEGSFLDVDPCSFGSLGVAAIPGFARFYRHVLIQKRFPHHGAYGFDHAGKALFEARKEARKAKNWAESDRIRDELRAQGIIVEDTPQGMKWKRA